jgi:amidase
MTSHLDSIADDTRWLDATDQAALVARGEVTPGELLEAAIVRIGRLDPLLNALTVRWFDRARETAADPALPAGPFRGVPFLLKDLWAHFAGETLTNGNRVLREMAPISPADTTLVARYRAAGLVIAGRTNSPELGSLPVTEPEAWGPTRNPWDPTRTSGGSSGGAAAAVASGMVPIAHASDGGGSIRIPAACCGLVGLKPSQGRMTLGPYRDESNLGVEHCVSRSVRDTAALLDATHGPGVGDTVIAPPPARPYVAEVDAEPGRLRVGVLDHDPRNGTRDPDGADAVAGTAALLESLGHHVEPGYPPALADTSFGPRFMALWSTNMGSSIRVFEELIGRPFTAADVEAVNWAQSEYARRCSAIDYAEALTAARQYRRAVQAWWAGGWDLLLTPTLGEPPPPVGSFANDADNPMSPMVRAATFVPFTPAYNTSGQPAISLPMHWNAAGLPIGIQLVAAYGREDILLNVAGQLERARPWAHRRPPV